MKAIVTGSTGMRGQQLVRHLHNLNWRVLTWNRSLVSITNEDEIYQYLKRTQVEVVFHLGHYTQENGIKNESWLVNYEWPRTLAIVCEKLNIKLIYFSSSDVYSSLIKGPYKKKQQANARSGNGYEKRMAEHSLLSINPNCHIYRVGWLITGSGNKLQLINDIIAQSTSDEKILLNRNELPACSFTQQTYQAIIENFHAVGGIYQLDSNRMWSQYEIALSLNSLFNLNLKISGFDGPVIDKRLLEASINMPPLNKNIQL